MQICRLLAGYSYARADNVRRAMSKKKASVMEAEREAFDAGCMERGISKEKAETIFDEMVGFAQYAFNKSHATAYGIISYRTAYLKAHYPAEYFSALLTSVLDSTSKVREYIIDAQRFGVAVLPPDINTSRESFSTDKNNIRYGLLAIKNVGRQFAKTVISERRKSPFKSFDDFVRRMINSDINKRTVESLIKCGVFDSLGVPRSALIECYESILDGEHSKIRNNISGQMDMFSQLTAVSSGTGGYVYPDMEEYPLKELLILEKESSGMYFSGHMVDDFSKHISILATDKISDIMAAFSDADTDSGKRYEDRSSVKLAGIITAKRTKIIKNGDTMAFITLDDGYGEIEVIVFARQYKQFSHMLAVDGAICIMGTVSIDEGEAPKVLMSAAETLSSNSEYVARFEKTASDTEKRIYIKVPTISDVRINKIYRLSVLNPGRTRVVIYDESSKKYSMMKDVLIDSSNKVLERLYSSFSQENVKLV